MRWLATMALVVLLACPAAPALAMTPATAPVTQPQPAAVAPAGCPGQQAPPGPAAKEERAAPTVAPLPWPAEPVGGPAMGACGRIGPDGAPDLTAESWVLADLDTGEVLAAKAPHARHRPASTLKVLTALVAIEHLDLDRVVIGTTSDQAIDGSKAGLGPDGQYTVRQVLGGLLLNSGNDAAHALAREMGGDEATVAAMTEKAHELGALDTRPATPSGLDGPGMASSAYDLALLYRAAMHEPAFAGTIALRSIQFPGYREQPGFELYNSSKLLATYPGALGSKTGFTEAARHTIISGAEHDGRRLVVALVRGEQRPVPLWKQSENLLDWGFELPASTPPVGQLVDETPAPPAPDDTSGAAAVLAAHGDQPAAAGEAVPPALLPIGLGAIAVAGMIIGGLALRRRGSRSRG